MLFYFKELELLIIEIFFEHTHLRIRTVMHAYYEHIG